MENGAKSMKKLNGKNLESMLSYLHQNIHENVDWSLESLKDGALKRMISYPPDVELTDAECDKLSTVLTQHPEVEVTIKKIMRNVCMYPLFDLFNFIDGTGDIPNSSYENIELIECTFDEVEQLEDREDFLHDMLMETYWGWKEKD